MMTRMTDTKLIATMHYAIRVGGRDFPAALMTEARINHIIVGAEIDYFHNNSKYINKIKVIKVYYGLKIFCFEDVINKLKENKLISEVSSYGVTWYASIHQPDMALLEGDELQYIDNAIKEYCGQLTDLEAEEKYCNEWWEMADIGDELPIGLHFNSYVVRLSPEAAESIALNNI